MRERRVEDAARAVYLASVAERRTRAASVQAHFWVFEHAGEPGRFLEFTEAKREEDLVALVGPEAAENRWGEIQGE
jgi:hypothetical protein